jgi:hypothetical protein
VRRFAREAGYTHIVLWTNSVLLAAPAHHAKAGYRLVKERAAHELRPRPGRRDLGAALVGT